MSEAVTKELLVKLGVIWVTLSEVCCSCSNTMFLLGKYRLRGQTRHELQLLGTLLEWFSYHERANFIPVNTC